MTEATAHNPAIERIDDLSQHGADPTFVERVPIAFARRHSLLGLVHNNGRLPVAISRTGDLQPLDAVARYLQTPVTPVLAESEAILSAINNAYGQRETEVDSVVDAIDRDTLLTPEALGGSREDLLDSGEKAPVIKLANMILFEAVKQQASDVHVQPYEDRLAVRMRVDGVMFEAFDLPMALAEEMASRLKIMGKMDIAEKRLPQDGRATVRVGDRTIDLRIASLPTSFGERIVIRLLDKSARLYHLDELGMDTDTLTQFRGAIDIEHGLVLVTGPTGSGKSTTLYGALLEMDCVEQNVLTLEDPIEYQLPGVSQTQINTKKGMTFASGLRNVLRQDPDVIMVGEIRDRETATMAIQSSLTGHLVFSTLHTNDAASAVTRLLDLGIEPYLVASSVVAVLAQRLVRRVCPDCAEPYDLSTVDMARLNVSAASVVFHEATPRIGRGCAACRQTGYRGRVGLFELLTVETRVRELITGRATAHEIEASAIARGMATLREGGLAKIAAGVTTPSEVIRVTARAVSLTQEAEPL